jgi:hypothetical protein
MSGKSLGSSFFSTSLATGIPAGVGNADFSNTATGTYTDGGISYKYITFNSSGTLTVTKAGFATVLVVSGGGGGAVSSNVRAGGGGGGVIEQSLFLPVATHTITIGAGGAGNSATPGATGSNGQVSSIGTLAKTGFGGGGRTWSGSLFAIDWTSGSGGGGGGGFRFDANNNADGAAGGGAGGTTFGSNISHGRASVITNTSVTYGAGGSASGSANASANTGNGGPGGNFNGGSGIVVIRVQT